MSEHTVTVDPRWLENPHDCQYVARCTWCGWRQETVTYQHALLIAGAHQRGPQVANHPADRQRPWTDAQRPWRHSPMEEH